jgi:ADP-ribose pyrophosphatase
MMDERRESRISHDRIYSGRVVTLDIDRVSLPDGSETVREVVRHPGAVVVLPILGDGRIVFVRQYRYPTGQELYELPAGTLEDGEDEESCGARELIEETGWRAGSLRRLGSFFSTPGFSDEILHPMLATGLIPAEGGARPDPDEWIQPVKMTVDEAFEHACSGGLRDGKSLATLFLARLHGHI